MINQIKRNRTFYILTASFILIGLGIFSMIDSGDVVLYFAQDRNHLLNIFFKTVTQFGEEITYASILIVLLFIRIRYALLIPIIGLLVTIVSYLFKHSFQHPRPAMFFRGSPKIENIEYVDGVDLLVGLNSFPSGHTLSAFCLMGFFAYTLHKQRYALLLQSLCAFLAILVAISRIYLFQHFLKDVIFGAFLGSLLAILCIALVEWPKYMPDKWYDKTLLQIWSAPKQKMKV